MRGLLPLVAIWFVQAVMVIGIATIATMLLHISGIEIVIWIVAGVFVIGCSIIALFIATEWDDDRR